LTPVADVSQLPLQSIQISTDQPGSFHLVGIATLFSLSISMIGNAVASILCVNAHLLSPPERGSFEYSRRLVKWKIRCPQIKNLKSPLFRIQKVHWPPFRFL
jgi:hypothetical protein